MRKSDQRRGRRTGRIRTAEGKNDALHRECGREEPARTRVSLLKKDDFGAGSAWEVRSKLKIDGSRSETELDSQSVNSFSLHRTPVKMAKVGDTPCSPMSNKQTTLQRSQYHQELTKLHVVSMRQE